jgi:predicted enzyme related to lactoylglutathione lyase
VGATIAAAMTTLRATRRSATVGPSTNQEADMPEMTTYQHGVPSWVDMGAHDVAAAIGFYSDLLGWEETQNMGPEAGTYTIAKIGGKDVAGLSVAQSPGPPYWTTYVNVDSVDDIVTKAQAAGGSVIVGPMDVMSAGRMVILADTTGAAIAAWQAGEHKGAGVVNEPGTFVWCELSTSDLAKSKAFYAEVFGWGWGGSDDYAEAQVDGRTVAGTMPRPPMMPAEVPDHWLVYFGVADIEGSASRAGDMGATVVVPPTAIPGDGGGRFCVVLDPQGAAFGLFQA